MVVIKYSEIGFKIEKICTLSEIVRCNKMKEKDFLNRIIIDPKVMVGKPIIKGTRLTVQHIIALLAQGMTTEEILHEYKNLTLKDILACLAFEKPH